MLACWNPSPISPGSPCSVGALFPIEKYLGSSYRYSKAGGMLGTETQMQHREWCQHKVHSPGNICGGAQRAGCFIFARARSSQENDSLLHILRWPQTIVEVRLCFALHYLANYIYLPLCPDFLFYFTRRHCTHTRLEAPKHVDVSKLPKSPNSVDCRHRKFSELFRTFQNFSNSIAVRYAQKEGTAVRVQ